MKKQWVIWFNPNLIRLDPTLTGFDAFEPNSNKNLDHVA